MSSVAPPPRRLGGVPHLEADGSDGESSRVARRSIEVGAPSRSCENLDTRLAADVAVPGRERDGQSRLAVRSETVEPAPPSQRRAAQPVTPPKSGKDGRGLNDALFGNIPVDGRRHIHASAGPPPPPAAYLHPGRPRDAAGVDANGQDEAGPSYP